MKKTITLLLTMSLVLLSLAGCGKGGKQSEPKNDEMVKTGLAVITSIEKSTDATEKDGLAQIDTTVAAVTVDKDGTIVKCTIDAIQTKINFNKTGKITTDLKAKIKTKQELGTDYGMKKASSIGKEWNEEASAFAKYAIGKTINEIKGIKVDEKGAPKDSELKSSVTVSVGGFIAAIEKASKNAKDLGAKKNDKLGIGAVTNIAKSKDATTEDGIGEAYSSYAATTFNDSGKITSCVIDSSQTDVKFNAQGKITSDLKAENKTKTELGAGYGMKKASGIGKEWFEQANSLAKYVVGKSVSEIKGISVNDKGAPTVSELVSSVTISIGDYIAAIEKSEANSK